MKQYLLFALTLLNAAFLSAQVSNPVVNHPLALDPTLEPFYHGVASGDPLPNSVIIWTRVTPYDTAATATVSVNWRVATDTNMSQVVDSGTVITNANVDFTVKVDVTGLQPFTFYFYEFSALGSYSLRGRTKTAPATAADVDSLRFALVACSNYPYGYFNAYSSVNKGNDVDAVIHLGDYIYEYKSGYSTGTDSSRQNVPDKEIISLVDYRSRYSHYRLDPDLRKLHQQYPWMIIWDDHEAANDSYKDGAENHTEGTEGLWIDRKKYAMRAWTEWIPTRKPNPADSMQIFRTIKYGGLANIYLLDTRLFARDKQNSAQASDTNRTILGTTQRTWLFNELSTSTAKWNIVAQQVMIAPLSAGPFFDPLTVVKDLKADMWEGYKADRLKIINHIINNNIKNVVIITGDIHTSWANDLPTSSYVAGTPATGSAAVEFVTTSVTSPGLEAWLGTNPPSSTVYQYNPHIKYVNLNDKGYNILDINKIRTQNDFYFINTIKVPNDSSQAKDYWFVNDNERSLRHATATSVPRPSLNYMFAPAAPRFVGIRELNSLKNLRILGIYPNPTTDFMMVQFFLDKPAETLIKLADITGKIVRQKKAGNPTNGVNFEYMDLGGLANGTYILMFTVGTETARQKVVKQ